MKTIIALWKAVVCQTVHRNMKMVHVDGYEHLITCQTCGLKTSSIIELKKNLILTHWYFAPRIYDVPMFILFFIVGCTHKALTRREGSFVHPPEHGNVKELAAGVKGG